MSIGVCRCLRESMGGHRFSDVCGCLWLSIGVYDCLCVSYVSMGVKFDDSKNFFFSV